MQITETLIHADGSEEVVTRDETAGEEAARLASESAVPVPNIEDRLTALENAFLSTL